MSSRRERTGWYLYDWANSAFVTSVVTVFIGPYLTAVATAAADPSGYLHPFGVRIYAKALFPYLITASVFTQLVLLPLVGAWTDRSSRKPALLGLFAYTGAFATMGLYFLDGTNWALGAVLFLIANLAFGSSIVVYNAFLPEIAGPDERDRVSSLGWALGYIGGGTLLALNLVLVSQADRFGLSLGQAVRISMASAGAWWAIFAVVPMALLRARPASHPPGPDDGSALTAGFRQLWGTIKSARRYPQTMLFLGAYLLYNDGIQTAINQAATFGSEELKLPTETLTTVILMIQFVAFFGALFFDRVARRLGAKHTVALTLAIWCGAIIYAYAALHDAAGFYVLGAVIALVLGGSQALSRSLFSLMIPPGREAEYFSLYEISDRGSSLLGPLAFALALELTHSFRVALLSLIFFFIAGGLLLLRLDVRRAAIEAGNEPPARA